MACRPRKRPTAEGVMYRDLNKFTLYGITLKEAPTTTLKKPMKNKNIYILIYLLIIY